MKHFLLILTAAAALSACDKQPAADDEKSQAKSNGEEAEGAGDTVQLKDGHGLAFHPKVMKTIGLTTAEVTEQKIAPKFTAPLHVIIGAGDGFQRVALTPGAERRTEANGWLSADKAALLKPGQEVELHADLPGAAAVEKGIVKRVEKSPYAMLGDFEVVVETATPFDTGTRITAVFHTPETEEVTTVPRSALLRTAEGWFVYAVNENFFLRTAVKVGSMNDEFVEITDGLYPGDQIVTAPVNTLWMAELQILRGGKACTCGH